MKKESKNLYGGEYAKMLSDLQDSLGIPITKNTNEEVDFHVFRSQQPDSNESDYSRRWLLCQFSPLMLKIARQKVFHKANGFTGRSYTYFVKNVRPENVEDLVGELFLKFPEFIQEYNWSTIFNSWIKDKLEWYAFNFHSKNSKISEREVTNLDANITSEDDEDSQTHKSQTSFEEGLWHHSSNQRDIAHNNHLIKKVISFVENTFPEKKKKIFYLYFDKDMNRKDSMSGVAIKCKHGYHSTVSNVIREIKEKIMEFLSKEDEIFDEYYQKYQETKPEYRIELNGPARLIDVDEGTFSLDFLETDFSSFEFDTNSPEDLEAEDSEPSGEIAAPVFPKSDNVDIINVRQEQERISFILDEINFENVPEIDIPSFDLEEETETEHDRAELIRN